MSKFEFVEYYPEVEGLTEIELTFVKHEVESGNNVDNAIDMMYQIHTAKYIQYA